ncbi:alpha-crystallin A chain-like [Uloborus diversus]|uniref:alpha-crystallin A chain-like n=1 Tax=Uloborus diversus TaxID=327109 RepID=UPI0024094D56|nr:alpha-crystallin A chain-like [Uloborus diversus]
MSLHALVPALLGKDWWDTWDYPTRIVDQFFGDTLLEDDLTPERFYRGFLLRPRTRANIDASGISEVKNDDQQFKVSLNVSQFKPEDLEVKVVDNYITIHGKHEEKSDEHGFVSREFTRKYMLPHNCEMQTVSSSLGPDGILSITAPKKAIEQPPQKEISIPIAKESKK